MPLDNAESIPNRPVTWRTLYVVLGIAGSLTIGSGVVSWRAAKDLAPESAVQDLQKRTATLEESEGAQDVKLGDIQQRVGQMQEVVSRDHDLLLRIGGRLGVAPQP